MSLQRDLVAQWVGKADEDFEIAVYLLDSGRQFSSGIGFHAQQAAEKYLKALLVLHAVDVEKTHAIGRILKRLDAVYPGIAPELEAADELTPFGVEVRFPADVPEVLPGEEEHLVHLARRVRDRVMRVLSGYLASGD
jgi:HEPN domain-containing protein